MNQFLKMYINKLQEKLKGRIFLKNDIDLPYELIGNHEMDSCMVFMDYFRKTSFTDGRQVVIYSAGIGDQINFELDLLEKLKRAGVEAQLYAIDPTPKSLAYLNTQNLPDNFHVLPYALSDRDEMLEFALPTAEGWMGERKYRRRKE